MYEKRRQNTRVSANLLINSFYEFYLMASFLLSNRQVVRAEVEGEVPNRSKRTAYIDEEHPHPRKLSQHLLTQCTPK